MENNIDIQLELAISTEGESYSVSEELFTGYNPEKDEWVLLIRYNDNIDDLKERYLVNIFYLLAEYAIITIKQNNIYSFASDPRIVYIEKPNNIYTQTSFPLYKSCIYDNFYTEGGLTGRGVLVAIIDSGIDYSHPEFLSDGKTRIYEIWDQTQEYSPENNNDYDLGRIYSSEEINENLSEIIETAASDVKISRLTTDNTGHGTGVASIACGGQTGVARDSKILVVKTGSDRLGPNPNTLGLILGIDYSIRTSINTGLPVVINVSFGNNYGSHEGNSLLENYIDDVSRLARCSIVTGTGNDGITGRSFQGMLGNVSHSYIDFLVSDYVTSFNIQVWKSYQDIFDLVLVGPNGENVIYISETGRMASGTYYDTKVNAIYGQPNPYNQSQQIYINIFSDRYVNSGIWRIILYPKKIIDGQYNIYLPVADSTSGNVQFISPVDFGTLTIPSTARNIIAVAAYNANYDDFAYFSGRGYTADNRIKPDLAAPGTDIYTAYPGGGYIFVSGTSFAAPFVSGACAMLMEWGLTNGNDIFLYGEKIKAALIRGARRLPVIDDYPNPYIGWGALCVRNTLVKLMGL